MEDNNENILLNNHHSEDYIYKLIEKVNAIGDKELIQLVQKLINERNNLSEIADIDILTGLNNRRILSNIKNVTGILMIDIDNFKDINDTFGHDVGDYIIKTVADIIKNSTRSSDYVCRYGGDEFLVAFINCPENVIRDRAEKVCNYVASNIKIEDKDVTVSIGMAINYTANSQINEVIKQADIALYQSKKNGKSQVNSFTPDEYTSQIHK